MPGPEALARIDIDHQLEAAWWIVQDPSASSPEQVLAFRPEISDLPTGFEVIADETLGVPGNDSGSKVGENMLSKEVLEATIAALEKQLEESEGEWAPPAVTSGNKPIEILSITSNDAGIDDGSMYAYVGVQK